MVLRNVTVAIKDFTNQVVPDAVLTVSLTKDGAVKPANPTDPLKYILANEVKTFPIGEMGEKVIQLDDSNDILPIDGTDIRPRYICQLAAPDWNGVGFSARDAKFLTEDVNFAQWLVEDSPPPEPVPQPSHTVDIAARDQIKGINDYLVNPTDTRVFRVYQASNYLEGINLKEDLDGDYVLVIRDQQYAVPDPGHRAGPNAVNRLIIYIADADGVGLTIHSQNYEYTDGPTVIPFNISGDEERNARLQEFLNETPGEVNFRLNFLQDNVSLEGPYYYRFPINKDLVVLSGDGVDQTARAAAKNAQDTADENQTELTEEISNRRDGDRITRHTAGSAVAMSAAITSLAGEDLSGIIQITADFETDFPVFGEYREGETWYLAGSDSAERNLVKIGEQRRPGFTGLQCIPPGVSDATMLQRDYALILGRKQGVPGQTANIRIIAQNSNRTQDFTVHEEAWTAGSPKEIITFSIDAEEYAKIVAPGVPAGELNMQVAFLDDSSNPVVIGRVPFVIGIGDVYAVSEGEVTTAQFNEEKRLRKEGDEFVSYQVRTKDGFSTVLAQHAAGDAASIFVVTADFATDVRSYITGQVWYAAPHWTQEVLLNLLFTLPEDADARLDLIEAPGWVTDTRLSLELQVALLDMRVSPLVRTDAAGEYTLAFTADQISGTAYYRILLNGVPVTQRVQWAGDSSITVTPTAQQVAAIKTNDASKVQVNIEFYTAFRGGTPLGGHTIIVGIGSSGGGPTGIPDAPSGAGRYELNVPDSGDPTWTPKDQRVNIMSGTRSLSTSTLQAFPITQQIQRGRKYYAIVSDGDVTTRTMATPEFFGDDLLDTGVNLGGQYNSRQEDNVFGISAGRIWAQNGPTTLYLANDGNNRNRLYAATDQNNRYVLRALYLLP